MEAAVPEPGRACVPDGTRRPSRAIPRPSSIRITKLPLAHQPGKVLSTGFDRRAGCGGEKVSEQRLGDYLASNVWQPTRHERCHVPPGRRRSVRVAGRFRRYPLTGKPQAIKLLDTPTKSDCGGACAFATVGDYVRFGQMLLNGGELDGQRVLGPKTVHHMISNDLGPEIENNVANVERIAPASASASGWRSAPARACRRFRQPRRVQLGTAPTARSSSPIPRSVSSWWSDTETPRRTQEYYREQVQDIIYGAMVE